MTDDFLNAPTPHPITGQLWHPAWEAVRWRRTELYIMSRARRHEDREPSRMGIALAVLGVIVIFVSLIAGVSHG